MIPYFAYGSNMLVSRIREAKRAPGAQFLGVAVLRDHGLRWHKRGKDGSGKCDVVSAAGETVYGVLFSIPPAERMGLDKEEGLGSHYRAVEVSVLQEGKEVVAFAYVALPDKIKPGLRPTKEYKGFVVNGAKEHFLPEDYVAALESTPTHD